MIETTIPDINVSELMHRIRLEAARLGRESPNGSSPIGPSSTRLPALEPVSAPPPLVLPEPLDPRKQRLDAMMDDARGKTAVDRWIPKMFRGLFRKQGGFNHVVLDALAQINKTNTALAGRVQQLTACVAVQHDWLQTLSRRHEGDASWMAAAEQTLSDLSKLAQDIGNLRADLGSLQATVAVMEGEGGEAREKLFDLEADVAQLGDDHGKSKIELSALATRITAGLAEQQSLRGALDELAAQLNASNDAHARFRSDIMVGREEAKAERLALESNAKILRVEFDGVSEHLRNLQAETDRLGLVASTLQTDIAVRSEHAIQLEKHLKEQIQALISQRDALQEGLARLEQRQTSDGMFVKAELSEHRAVLQEARSGRVQPADPRKQSRQGEEVPPKGHSQQFDSFYLSFEDRFRGPRAEIKERVKFYLPYLKKAHIGTKTRPIVDLGCGRGEWLELLRENKLSAVGVDLNKIMIDECKERKLDVTQMDAVEYLRSLKTRSQGAVTGFHIIEHLPFETLVELFTQSRRVLKPGGLAIFESPNCKNLVVGATNFNIDPTHRRPVFPETAQFLLETLGFERVAIEYLSPVDTKPLGNVEEESPRIRHLLYGPQDFAVIGYVSDGK